ncbi:probable serine/threonine-protein kinase PBL15 isoform X2 [Rhodamnia argentea]|uniref:Probable serine/threonine-protein kinase PBL15 isoform X2 n=1 Tax=Rhodamnia argentea TaxID=178133 RepID=A0ABM3GX68_9MYRT|nr:probable serine/threonine-protein kinase PBL15 isoform X2 [Rhodamnia argentea]
MTPITIKKLNPESKYSKSGRVRDLSYDHEQFYGRAWRKVSLLLRCMVQVRIKTLKNLVRFCFQGLLGLVLSRPNIVRLMGYCLEDKELLLVHEFMPEGGSAIEPLPWVMRMKIATGAVKGLTFLHLLGRFSHITQELPLQSIFETWFVSRILGWQERVQTKDRSQVTTQVIGSYGYAAPEYVATDFGEGVKPHLSIMKLTRINVLTTGRGTLKDAPYEAAPASQCLRYCPSTGHR